MAQATVEQFKLSDGKELYMEKWNPSGSPVAKLIFVHGFSDHCHRYYEFFPTLAEHGILAIAFDQRGFGRSVEKPSEKGDTGPTALVLADLVEVIKAQLPSPVPVFVMGHSMGGGEVLTLMSTPQYQDLMPQIRGWLCESPFIGLAFKPSSFTVLAGRLAGKVLPRMHLVQAIPPKDLSRDPAVIKSLEDDKMCDGTGTLQMFANMLDRGAALEEGRTRLNKDIKSLLISHGSGDLATSYPASEKYLADQKTVGDKTFKSYDGWFHQLHADKPETRVIFFKDIAEWVLARSGTAEVKTTETEAVTKASETPVGSAAVESKKPAPVEEQAKL